jgi:SAM-dependent methyltransferase
MTDPYREDLAFIHDAGFGGFARAAAPVLLNALRRAKLDRGLVIDLGCGSGILSAAVAAAGYEVLGIDISSAMIELARRQVPGGTFVVGSLLQVELPPCIAVAAVGECVNYLFDESNTDAALEALLRRIFAALCSGGCLLFDASGPGRARPPSKGYTEGDGWAVLASAEEDTDSRFLTRRITSFRQVGELYRRDHEVHRLRLLAPAHVAGMLRAAGFRVRVLRGYDERRLSRGWAAFLARRP